MRRGVGLAAVKKNELIKEKFKEKGTEIDSLRIDKMKDRLNFFRTSLEEFARKHKKDINKDPAFRHQFAQMCQKIGVDPLASNKGFWAELLGVGDFYYELGVQIIEVCMKTRNQNGGLIELDELCTRVTKMRTRFNKQAQEISKDDIIQAIKNAKHLGKGFEVLQIGSRLVVQSVPCELMEDHTKLLALAQETGRGLTKDEFVSKLAWTPERVNIVLNQLLQDGFAWIDDQGKTSEYWFPGLLDQEKMEL